MARIVIHEAKMPMEIKVGNESKWICMCGLSKNKPFCDGSHKQTQDEKEGSFTNMLMEKELRLKSFNF